MRISKLFRFRETISKGLMLPFLFWCLNAPAFAAPRSEDPLRLSVKGVEVRGDIILVSYELVVPAGVRCEVSLILLKESDPSFRLPAKSASGDLGEANYTSGSKQIVWEYKKDVSGSLWGDGFYVEVTISRLSGTSAWWYIGIGAALAGGGAFLALGKKTGGGTTTPSVPGVTELPLPPSRPGN